MAYLAGRIFPRKLMEKIAYTVDLCATYNRFKRIKTTVGALGALQKLRECLFIDISVFGLL